MLDRYLNGLLAADPVTSETVSDGTHGISDREKGTSPPLPPPPAPPLMPLPQSLGESESSVPSEEKAEEEEASDNSDADCRGGGCTAAKGGRWVGAGG